ncbi:mediator-associated protein 2 [Cornus florida]|uniref:mediator-associated protein 2 n=1 Tax=Cornus florida TaxID=4283 RepID=UPI002898F3A2|nr:mediator-associated protein 2 [Cornus florida]
MDAVNEVAYSPPAGYQEDAKDPLVELNLSDSTEFWLIQWPINQPPDFDGQELTLKLHRDGQLGSFEGSSGKSYHMVSFAAHDPDATVFVSSKSEPKIAGKISRRVSLVHYPDPNELQKHDTKNLKQMYQRSSGTSLTNSPRHFATPSQGFRPRKSKAATSSAVSTKITNSNGSRQRSSVSEVEEPSDPPKKIRTVRPTSSTDHSTQDSGRVHSVVTSSGSLEHSNERKSKKRRKNVE